MATKATAQAVSLNLEKIADVAGKISIDDLKVKSPTELTSIKKMIPEFLIEKQLNESLGRLIRLKWGLTVQTFGAKAVLIAVQTPSTGTYSFTIYKKEQKLILLIQVVVRINLRVRMNQDVTHHMNLLIRKISLILKESNPMHKHMLKILLILQHMLTIIIIVLQF